jgi:hypothetical protein
LKKDVANILTENGRWKTAGTILPSSITGEERGSERPR